MCVVVLFVPISFRYVFQYITSYVSFFTMKNVSLMIETPVKKMNFVQTYKCEWRFVFLVPFWSWIKRIFPYIWRLLHPYSVEPSFLKCSHGDNSIQKRLLLIPEILIPKRQMLVIDELRSIMGVYFQTCLSIRSMAELSWEVDNRFCISLEKTVEYPSDRYKGLYISQTW